MMSFASAIDLSLEAFAPLEVYTPLEDLSPMEDLSPSEAQPLLTKTTSRCGSSNQSRSGRKFEFMSFASAIDHLFEVFALLEVYSYVEDLSRLEDLSPSEAQFLLTKTILRYGSPSQFRSGRKFETMSFAVGTDFMESETLVTTAVLCKT